PMQPNQHTNNHDWLVISTLTDTYGPVGMWANSPNEWTLMMQENALGTNEVIADDSETTSNKEIFAFTFSLVFTLLCLSLVTLTRDNVKLPKSTAIKTQDSVQKVLISVR
ncbi:hypothetical protein, partial [Nostoc sp.]